MKFPKKEFGGAASGIATRAELLQRIANRATPQIVRHLTMDGPEAALVHRQVDVANESRIEHLKDKLLDAREKLRTGQALGQVRDKAMKGFNRSR